MTTIAQQLGQLEQDIYALAKRPSSEVLLAIDSRISAIRAAVGGEAVVVVAHRLHTPGGKWQWMNGMPSKQALDDSKNFGWEMEYAYASPPATVDVGALRRFAERLRLMDERTLTAVRSAQLMVTDKQYEVVTLEPAAWQILRDYIRQRGNLAAELAALIGGSK